MSLTVRDSLAQAEQVLTQSGCTEPRANAEFLLAHLLHTSRTWLTAFGQEPLPADKQQAYERLVARHAAGEPLAYITGFQPFCNLEISVTPDVLIPRPETEELVEWAAHFFNPAAPLKILDLCTGSGCIALALAAQLPHACVTAADISLRALQVARHNAERLKLQEKITFIESNLWENVQGDFDMIVSNPPYIPSGDLPGLMREVQAEPALALDGGPDGLRLTRQIIRRAGRFTHAGSILGLELCQGQPAAVAALLNGLGWRATVKKDIFGIERFVLAQKI
ncbi:peptide chain release factor N(5)-glutamine methyltransferase [Candidatus Avelusimicrobium faecicola]|uniref:peptide chain release factor N(5)-glutamine methyltransferase n=1 Tax=Candidatus Avelusimicrobium faecicola TaxID=3416205 RepID=UPI003D11D953